MITIPKAFAQRQSSLSGDAGRSWIASLPMTVAHLCERWKLVVDGAPMHGELGVVVPVLRGEDRLVLKVSWLEESTAHEILALSVWKGRGAVRLLASDQQRGAMLLERLVSDRSLGDVPLDDAVVVAGRLLRRLAVRAPPGPPTLASITAELHDSLPERWKQLGRPTPRRTLEAAQALAIDLGATGSDLLVDCDLHYDNVLAGRREPWLVIDPKVVVGDPEYQIAQLLWWRFDEIEDGGLRRCFDALVDAADADVETARAWTIVRSVDYWLWGLANGLTEDPVKCRAIVESFL